METATERKADTQVRSLRSGARGLCSSEAAPAPGRDGKSRVARLCNAAGLCTNHAGV